jgi:FkbM family methyltransferase
VTSWANYPGAILGSTEPSLIAWLGRHVKPGQTWLDIGAHYGYTALAIARLVGSSGRVYAFEPVVSTAGYLSETRNLNSTNQLTVVPLALGDQPELTRVVVPATRGMADHTQTNAPKETIFVIALDRLWPCISARDLAIHGIKLDVQGMEVEALRGMSRTLRALRPQLIIEVHHGVNRHELLDLVEELGYDRHPITLDATEDRDDTRLLDDTNYAFRPQGTSISELA